jgi:hypothetical protein
VTATEDMSKILTAEGGVMFDTVVHADVGEVERVFAVGAAEELRHVRRHEIAERGREAGRSM